MTNIGKKSVNTTIANKYLLCIVSTPPPTGGASIMNQNTINILRDNKYHVIHINPKYAKKASDREKASFTKLFELIRIFCNVIFYCAFYKIDKVYYGLSSNINAFLKDFIILSIPILFKKKIIIHLHLSNLIEFYYQGDAVIQKMMRFIIRKATLFLVLSENLKNKFQEIIPAEKMAVVVNGIMPPKPNIISLKNKDKLICLFLGILIKSKGYDVVIEAAKYITDKDVIFYIAGPPGKDYDEHEMDQYIKNNGLAEKVFLVGPQYGDAKEEIYAKSDIFIFPTVFGPEAFPLVLLEAMSHGLCIITSRTGAISEIIEEGFNGYLLNDIDSREIANKIDYLNNHRQTIREISSNNLTTFNEKYSIEQYESNILKIFGS